MNRILALAFLAASMISIGSARAHAQTLEFKVPFGFTVGSHAFPAGIYEFSRLAPNSIFIQSQDRRFHAMTTTHGADGLPISGGKLVFHKYGEQYFLHEVHCSALDLNVAVPRSNLEKQAGLEEAQLPHIETLAALRNGPK
jgi:hypothetical protein